MKSTKILTPDNDEWGEFINRMILHLDIRENPEDKDYYFTDCDGTFKMSRNLLKNRFYEFDEEATIQFFQKKLNCYCDCDVFDKHPLSTKERKESKTN
jgi:hypothetical protein